VAANVVQYFFCYDVVISGDAVPLFAKHIDTGLHFWSECYSNFASNLFQQNHWLLEKH